MVGALRPYVKRDFCEPERGRRLGGQLRADGFEQVARSVRDLFDGFVECFLVLPRRHAVTTDLAYELKRGCAHFVVCRWLFWTAESLDAAAHPPSIRQRGTFGLPPSRAGSSILDRSPGVSRAR